MESTLPSPFRCVLLVVVAAALGCDGSVGPADASPDVRPVPADGGMASANDLTEPGEACDGTDLNGYTCSSVPAGFVGGTLRCRADRLGYDFSACVPGRTVSLTSCEQAEVQAAIDSAVDGDVIQVPAGTCTWTTPVRSGAFSDATRTTTSRSFVLRGAGMGLTTIIVETVPEPSVPNPGLLLRIQPGRPVRVTGFTFDGRGSVPSEGIIDVTGDVDDHTAFRVDHCAFVGLTARGVSVSFVYGLVDHDSFVKDPTAGSVTHISINGDITERTGSTNDSWARPQDLGTEHDVYMEDNTIDHPGIANGPFDAYEGARYVFRHNRVFGANLGHHGFDSALRGIVNFEIYENEITNASPTGAAYVHGVVMEFRSGSGVVFGNVVRRAAAPTATLGFYDAFALLRNYRSDEAWAGASSNGICNGTSPNDGNTPGAFGYPCRDQIGRSTNQTLSPVYAWDNDFQGMLGGNLEVAEHGTGTLAASYHILPNRDYYNDVPRPGYVPYPYPHPMAAIE